MTVYYALYLLLSLGAIVGFNYLRSEKWKRNYCAFAFILIGGLLAFRHPNMGIDLAYGSTNGYLGMFQTIAERNWEYVLSHKFLNYETGYVIFCKLISYVSTDEQMLLIACAFISVAAFSWLICKYSDDPFISVVVWLGLPIFLTNYSSMRQVIAIAITVVAHRYIFEKKPIKFILAVILAATFHSSALFFLLAYPLYYVKLNKQTQLCLTVILPICYILRYRLFDLLTSLFGYNASAEHTSAITLFLVLSAMYVFTVLFSEDNDQTQRGLTNIYFVACFCQAFGGVYSTALRMGYYFMVCLLVLLPRNLSYMKKRMKDNNVTYFLFYVTIFLAFCAFGLYSIKNTYWSKSCPYYFFWQTYV